MKISVWTKKFIAFEFWELLSNFCEFIIFAWIESEKYL